MWKKSTEQIQNDFTSYVTKRGHWKDKRKLLVQRGGFLPYIISLILSILLSRIIERSKLWESIMERAKKMVLISTENLERTATAVTSASYNDYRGIEGKRIAAAGEYQKR